VKLAAGAFALVSVRITLGMVAGDWNDAVWMKELLKIL